jgi:hypothetical protein
LENNTVVNPNQPDIAVEYIRINDEIERRVAIATIRIGDIRILGLTVWRGNKGRLRVYWPRYWNGAGQSEAIELLENLRTEIEAEVIAAYRERTKTQEKKSERGQ